LDRCVLTNHAELVCHSCSYVYALAHKTLDVVWTSAALPGVCEGTPKYADDDAYVFVIHNAGDGSEGRFSVLDTAAGATAIYTFSAVEGSFGPFGFYANPFPGGNYGAGTGNTNDIAVWGLKPSPGATSGEMGAVWVFQMPPATAIGGPAVVQTIPSTGWRYTAAPLLASQGQFLYWFISRSSIRAWYGSAFSVGSDGEYSFDRGTPAFKAAPYSPVVDNLDAPTIMCGGAANPEFGCFSATNINGVTGGTPLWTVPTEGNGVYGNPLMSTGGDRVYWSDNAGFISTADTDTGANGWNATTGVSLEANPTLSSDGARLYFADISGNIACWEVADGTLGPAPLEPLAPTVPTVPAPTPAEAAAPPSPAPSQAPSAQGDTFAPSASPAPTGEPTISPAPAGGDTGNTIMPSGGEGSGSEGSGGGGTPTDASPMGDTSGASSMAVFSFIAASVVAVVFF